MKVGLDTSPLAMTQAGTARWVRGLRRALEQRGDVEVVPLAWGGAGRLTAVARDLAWYPWLLPRAARRSTVEVLHCTIFRGPRHSSLPVVLTVHDLAPLRHPEAFPAWTRLYARTRLRATVRAARRVIAVSDFSRRETSTLCGVEPDRIDVVPNGVEPVFAPDGAAAEGDYVLAVGTLEPRKNLARTIEAARLAGAELRVVGARGWGRVEADGAHVRWLGRVGDEDLATLYRGARCLVYASLYEGFGIPVAEAMACGTPVVTSRDSAMADVADGAAVLVDPQDVRHIAAGIEEAVARRDELRAAGRERARLFTWERAAAAAVECYRQAVS